DGGGFEQLRVAGHAGRKRRNAGEGGAPDGAVAIAAIDPVVTDVMLVAEGHHRRHRSADRRGELDVSAPEEHTRDEDDERAERAKLQGENRARGENLHALRERQLRSLRVRLQPPVKLGTLLLSSTASRYCGLQITFRVARPPRPLPGRDCVRGP